MKALSKFFIIISLFSSYAFTAPLQNIVVFGDSLSDTNNAYKLSTIPYPPSPPYFNGRFSNGPVWVEYLVNLYFPNNGASRLFDYAQGGAAIVSEEQNSGNTFTLRNQITAYLKQHENAADPADLYIVWIGANNYITPLTDERYKGPVFNEEEQLELVRSGTLSQLKRLAEAGAANIIVMNLPDLGITPAARSKHQEEMLSRISVEHNKGLADTVIALQQDYPNVNWIYLNMYESFNRLYSFPTIFGFKDVLTQCMDHEISSSISIWDISRVGAGKNKVSDCKGYFFFDTVHPTTRAHKLLAKYVKRKLQDNGIEFTK